MKYYIYVLIVLTTISSYGQTLTDDWTVNEADFEFLMTFTGFVNLNGVRLTATNDMVGAFINGECRGFTHIAQNSVNGAYYVNFGVHTNVDEDPDVSDFGKDIQFKIYHSASDTITDIEQTLLVSNNPRIDYGDTFQPYSFAQPTLKTGAELFRVRFEALGFPEIYHTRNTTTNPSATIYLNKLENITNLNATFELSPGATVHFASGSNAFDEVVSGGNGLNFTSSIEFIVLSEDKSNAKTWEVIVITEPVIPVYLKKDAVCYEGGSIKVLSSAENRVVTLEFEGDKNFAQQSTTDGQVLFENLTEGVYTVQPDISADSKQILIRLINE
jgi:hypothetical protein